MNIAIIGYGSIGQRHEKNCLTLGHNVDVLSRHADKNLERDKYDLVMICSKTSEHISDVKKFMNLSANFLIEKPLAATCEHGLAIKKLLLGKKVRVGYCMIFDPIVVSVKEIIENNVLGDIGFSQIYAGSYLPNWRGGEDYRERYSAKKSEGGSVQLDLIHEINYLQYFFPDKLMDVKSYLTKISTLEITSHDFAHFDIRQKSRFVTITLNYFQLKAERYIKLVGEKGMLFADLVDKTLEVFGPSGKREVNRKFVFDYNQMYIDEMKSMERFIKGKEQQRDILSLDQAILDLKIVAAR